MSAPMEFWGVEVKSGHPLKINPGDNKIVHLSQASLGEVKKGSETVYLYMKVNDKKLVLGTLSAEKFPQLSFDLVVERDFELSHNWKNGSVYFTGYKIRADEGDAEEDEYDVEANEVPPTNNGKSRANSISEKTNATNPGSSSAKQKVKDVKSNQKAEDSDSDDGDLEGSSTDDENPNLANREVESDENSGDSEEDESDENTDESESDDEEETPSKAELSNKRPAKSANKTPVPDKKAKFITPQKTESKKGISHTATPHPSKQAGKTPANSVQTKQQAKKSGGSYPCKSCNRSFTTEGGLQAHTNAKHNAAA